jgi:serine/threonine protein kinase
LNIVKNIGKGKYSSVFLAQDKTTGFLLAVKQIKKDLLLKEQMEE